MIRSAERLTYSEAYAILQAPPNDELGERLHTAWELASLLRRKRFEHGSLDLDFPEVKVRVDEERPTDPPRADRERRIASIDRGIHARGQRSGRARAEEPTRSRRSIACTKIPIRKSSAEYREFVLSFGYQVGDLTQRKELQRLLASIRGKPEEQALKIGLLKSLKRARYLPQPLGHYGLAKNNYTHFTSPIRRYADLVVHRTLAELEQRDGARSTSDKSESADHISTTERNAAEAEIEAVKMKKLEFFQQQLEARNPQVFRATVIEVRNYGLLVELPDVLVTG